MKISESYLKRIIREELREAAKNISDPVRAVGGAERPRLEEWAFKLMNELTPEIPALQELPEAKFDGAVKRVADGMWEGLMSAIDLAPEPYLKEIMGITDEDYYGDTYMRAVDDLKSLGDEMGQEGDERSAIILELVTMLEGQYKEMFYK